MKIHTLLIKHWQLVAGVVLLDGWAGAAGYRGAQYLRQAESAFSFLRTVSVKNPASERIAADIQVLVLKCVGAEIAAICLAAGSLLWILAHRSSKVCSDTLDNKKVVQRGTPFKTQKTVMRGTLFHR